jgi:hypothetical protein
MKLQVQVQHAWRELSRRERRIVRQGVVRCGAGHAAQDRAGVGPGDVHPPSRSRPAKAPRERPGVQKETPETRRLGGFWWIKSGNTYSRAFGTTIGSESLTTVFGMGTGVTFQT